MTNRRTPWWSVLTLATACLFGFAISAAAATFYVDASNTTGIEDGTSANPYSAINPAVLATVSGDTIRVAAGTYNGDVTIDSKALRLLGADPAVTTLRGSQTVVYVIGTFAPGSNVVEIAGFTITGGGLRGVRFDSTTVSGFVHNCLIVSNNVGVGSVRCGANVFNNVITSNTTGVQGTYSGGSIAAINNIMYGNGTAVYANGSYNNKGYVNSSHNNLFNNTTNYSTNGYGTTANANDTVDLDPLFVDLDTSDFHLQNGSPCINTGSPLGADNDPDGTRNDKGVYGGPGAAGFWPEPAGSPVVTELTVTPHDVPLGGTLTVTAKGTAR